MKNIVIVGAGPAGMMAAITAAGLSSQVTLIEQNNQLGKKLLLSGKGRCNLTNACGIDSFLKRFNPKAEFLRDAFRSFFNQDLMRFFQDRGLALKVERQERVFPVSDRSSNIVDVLEKEINSRSINVLFKTKVKDLLLKDKQVQGVVLSDGKTIPAHKVILACGGISYRFTGSTGEGIEIARKLGHRIMPLRPGLVPIETKGTYPKLLEGLVLKNIRLTISDTKKKIVSPIGELLFTGFGVSGPLVLTLSGAIGDMLSHGKTVHIRIDLKPVLTKEQLDNRLRREFAANARKAIKNTLGELMPKRLIAVVLDILKIDPGKLASYITKEERYKLVDLLKGFCLEIKRTLPIEEAMVTRGGVSLKDINPRNMESRLVKGLYFCGEMIDVDADTGGFNLQAAFSTGYLAGESATRS